MTPEGQVWLGLAAAALSVAAHIPYMAGIVRGTNKPHIFTWVIWTLLTVIAYAAQVAGNGGPGAWSTGATIVMCVIITALAWRRGERDIARSDWVMFGAGLAALPVWLATQNPLGSVLIVTAIDALAFGPTIRKSWHKPHQENTTMYGVNILRHVLALAALSRFSLVTALYPAMLLAMNTGTYAMLKIRRLRLGL